MISANKILRHFDAFEILWHYKVTLAENQSKTFWPLLTNWAPLARPKWVLAKTIRSHLLVCHSGTTVSEVAIYNYYSFVCNAILPTAGLRRLQRLVSFVVYRPTQKNNWEKLTTFMGLSLNDENRRCDAVAKKTTLKNYLKTSQLTEISI